jgi:hypothetical protein
VDFYVEEEEEEEDEEDLSLTGEPEVREAITQTDGTTLSWWQTSFRGQPLMELPLEEMNLQQPLLGETST